MRAASQSRRHFLQGSLALAGSGFLAGCGLASALVPQRSKPPRYGYLSLSALKNLPTRTEAFQEGLRELGYVEGQNIIGEYRFADQLEQLPDLVRELVNQPVDTIVAVGTPAIQAARGGTSTIPIIMAWSGDPVRIGVVNSLAHPGGNVTGLSSLAPQVSARRLQLLKEAVPGLSRVAVFWNPAVPDKALDLQEMHAAAEVLGVEVRAFDGRSPDSFEVALQDAEQWRADSVVTLLDFLTNPYPWLPRLIGFALQRRLPSMCELRAFPEAGGMMSYGPTPLESYRRAATYVDKILKGAKPADLPVEQPTRFEFMINLKTAQAIGLTIPQSVLQQAAEIIQ